jgi:hypothetical protein
VVFIIVLVRLAQQADACNQSLQSC